MSKLRLAAKWLSVVAIGVTLLIGILMWDLKVVIPSAFALLGTLFTALDSPPLTKAHRRSLVGDILGHS